MHSSDYTSRHPVKCKQGQKCQICAFAGQVQLEGDRAAAIRNIAIKDILEGRAIMPYIQLKAWLGVQLSDWVHTNVRKLIDSGQHPDSKKTKGDFTVLKKLYNFYKSGDLKVRKDGLVMIKSKDGYFDGYVVSVPHKMFPGIAFSLHVKLGHPSKGQLSALMARYFYSYGGPGVIQMVTENCVQCRSVQQVPAAFAQDSTELVDALGTRFSIDVMERRGQKIFLAREKLSQYTWLELLQDQTASALRKAIVRTILPWVHNNGATVRCDGATALQSLATEANQEGSIFRQYKIILEVGRLNNPNKNPLAENAIKEAEKEILNMKPNHQTLSDEDLVVVARVMNERIRNRGVAAREILTRRDLITNKPKNIIDSKLSAQQFEQRLKKNQENFERKPKQAQKEDDIIYHKGDVVYVKAQKSKNAAREQFIITGFPEDMIMVQKLHSKLGSKTYVLYRHEIMHANLASDELYDNIRKQEEINDEAEQIEDKTLQSPEIPKEIPKRGRGRPRKVSHDIERQDTSLSVRPARATKTEARLKMKKILTIKIPESILKHKIKKQKLRAMVDPYDSQEELYYTSYHPRDIQEGSDSDMEGLELEEHSADGSMAGEIQQVDGISENDDDLSGDDEFGTPESVHSDDDEDYPEGYEHYRDNPELYEEDRDEEDEDDRYEGFQSDDEVSEEGRTGILNPARAVDVDVNSVANLDMALRDMEGAIPPALPPRNQNAPPVPLRRPHRVTKPPDYLKDYQT